MSGHVFTLDLRKALPKAGLPQFCRQDDPPVTVSLPDGLPAQAIALWANTPFVDARTGKEVRAWTTVANMVDVECAALQPQQRGKDEIKADACGGRFPPSAIAATHDASGRTLFTYGLSRNRKTAERRRLP